MKMWQHHVSWLQPTSWQVTRTNSSNNVELPAVICDISDAQNMSVISELIINHTSSWTSLCSIFVLGSVHYFVPGFLNWRGSNFLKFDFDQFWENVWWKCNFLVACYMFNFHLSLTLFTFTVFMCFSLSSSLCFFKLL